MHRRATRSHSIEITSDLNIIKYKPCYHELGGGFDSTHLDPSASVIMAKSCCVRRAPFSLLGVIFLFFSLQVPSSDGYRLRTWNSGNANGMYMGISISPDHTIVAVGTKSRTVELWNVSEQYWPTTNENRTGALPFQTLSGHDTEINTVPFSPDGRHLATPLSSGAVGIWDVSGYTSTNTNTQHNASVTAMLLRTLPNYGVWGANSITYSPNNGEYMYLLVGHSLDKYCTLWNVTANNYTLITTLPHFDVPPDYSGSVGISGSAFVANGQVIITGTFGKTHSFSGRYKISFNLHIIYRRRIWTWTTRTSRRFSPNHGILLTMLMTKQCKSFPIVPTRLMSPRGPEMALSKFGMSTLRNQLQRSCFKRPQPTGLMV